MHRRAAVIFKRYGNDAISHDNFVSTIYEILANGNKEMSTKLHSQIRGYKPFTYGKDDSYGNVTIYFSSLLPEVTKAFVDGATKLIGTALTIDTTLLKVIDVTPIPDLTYIGKKIRIKTLSPVVISKKGKNQKKVYVLYPHDPQEWIERVEKNIWKRAYHLNNHRTSIDNISVKPLVHGKSEHIKYKNGEIMGRHIALEIQADKEVLETVIYSGIGERTGSGFGMVLPF